MDLDTLMIVILSVLGAVCWVYHFIDSRGGWILYLAELKREVCKK